MGGTEGIQGLDLLGRKVPMGKMAGFQSFVGLVKSTIEAANANAELSALGDQLAQGLQQLQTITAELLPRLAEDPDRGLANATLYLDVFGRVTVSWVWLRQALIAAEKLQGDLTEDDQNFFKGKLQAARYYIEWELPEIEPQIRLLSAGNTTPFDMQNDWF